MRPQLAICIWVARYGKKEGKAKAKPGAKKDPTKKATPPS